MRRPTQTEVDIAIDHLESKGLHAAARFLRDQTASREPTQPADSPPGKRWCQQCTTYRLFELHSGKCVRCYAVLQP